MSPAKITPVTDPDAAQDDELPVQPKKRGRPAKPKQVAEPDFEPDSEPQTSNLLIVRCKRNTAKK